jgi:hypothetical protein
VPRGKQKFTLRRNRKDVFFVFDDNRWSGATGDVTLPPKPLSAVFSRLTRGAYFLKKFDLSKVNYSPTLSVREPYSFLVWTLKKGEEVVFRFTDFVAMSEQICLRTTFSPRIALFCLDRRFFFTTAIGPGVLILLTQGDVTFGDANTKTGPIAAQRLVAWNRGVEFSLDSKRDVWNVYLNDPFIIPNDSLAVSDRREVRRAGVVRRFLKLVKFLVLPW